MQRRFYQRHPGHSHGDCRRQVKFRGMDRRLHRWQSTCTLTLSASQQVTATFNPATNVSVLNHIIFLAQENRSFDHYFGALRGYWAQNGYPDQSFDGLPQFNPSSGRRRSRGQPRPIRVATPPRLRPAIASLMPISRSLRFI